VPRRVTSAGAEACGAETSGWALGVTETLPDLCMASRLRASCSQVKNPSPAWREVFGMALMDPLSLLCRLATSVPPPCLRTLRHAGVLAPASPARGGRLAPQRPQAAAAGDKPGRLDHGGATARGRSLWRVPFAVDVLACPTCQGRMKLLALVKRSLQTHAGRVRGGAPGEFWRQTRRAGERRAIGRACSCPLWCHLRRQTATLQAL
jgi:hypothetical protein